MAKKQTVPDNSAENEIGTHERETLALIRSLQAGDGSAFHEISLRYLPLIRKTVGSFTHATVLSEADQQDLFQECSIALYNAAMTFDTAQESVTFGLYAKRCLNNRMISYLRKAGSKRKKSGASAPEKLSAPRSSASSRQELRTVLETAQPGLTELEWNVLTRYVQGMRYKEIADDLGRSVKTVDNAFCRAKRKIRQRQK